MDFAVDVDLQFTPLQPDFASVYDAAGVAHGLHFRSADHLQELAAALDAAIGSASTPPKPSPALPMLYCLSHVVVRRDESARRGAHIKALAVASTHRFLHVWKPLLLLAIDRLFSVCAGKGECESAPWEQCGYLFDALNSIPASALPEESALRREVHRLLLSQDAVAQEAALVGHIAWLARAIPLRVPLMLQPQELSASAGDTTLSELLRRFRGGMLLAFRALLHRQRLLFLGHSQPAEQVCLAVLAMPLLVPWPHADVLERCYPYTTLSSLDYLHTDGFVAGATNPICEEHPEWWDVLCDLDSGRVLLATTSSSGRRSASEPPRLSDADAEFLEHVLAGVEARYSEYWLRSCFQDYAQQEAARRTLSGVAARALPLPTCDRIAVGLEQLRGQAKLSEYELYQFLFDVLLWTRSEDHLGQLLTMLPATSTLGVLSPIGVALFHPSQKARALAASILRALEERKETQACVANLNPFLLHGYHAAREWTVRAADEAAKAAPSP